MPSNLPPVGWLSMWLPVITGDSELSLPGRRAKMLPILSILMVQPASFAQRAEQVARLLVEIGQRETADAALLGGADLGHVHEAVPQTVGVDAQIGAQGKSPSFRQPQNQTLSGFSSNSPLIIL